VSVFPVWSTSGTTDFSGSAADSSAGSNSNDNMNTAAAIRDQRIKKSPYETFQGCDTQGDIIRGRRGRV
jgi:hypothetical protein